MQRTKRLPNREIRLSNAKHITISGNIINTTIANAVRIDGGCSNIAITNNIFPTTISCIFENNTNSKNIQMSDHTCKEL